MAATAEHPLLAAEDLDGSTLYLHDNTRLFRVLTAHEGQVCLEDCGDRDLTTSWLPVRELLDRRMRVVRRS